MCPWLGQRRVEPQVGLGVGDRMRVDDLHVGQHGSGPGDEHEIDRHQVFPDDAQVRDARQGVLRGAHAALDGVLHRDHRGHGATGDHVVQRLAHVIDGVPRLAGGRGHLLERRLRKSACRPQVAVGLSCCICELGTIWHGHECIGGA